MKKTIFLIALLCVATNSLKAQDHPTLDYINSLETTAEVDIQVDAVSSALDSQGNLIVLGTFNGMVDVDPSLNVYNLINPGPGNYMDLFLAKYDAAGNFIWAFNIGDNGKMAPKALSIDPYNNIVISGIFKYTVDFDPGFGQAIASTNAAGGFICKYSPNGAFLWKNHVINIINFGLLLNDHSTKFSGSLMDNGNTVIIGSFKSQITFPDVNGQNVNLNTNSQGFSDGFIAELNASGNWIRVQKIGVNGKNVEPRTINFDSNNDLITSVILKNSYSNNTFYKAYVTKYTSNWIGTDILTIGSNSIFKSLSINDLAIDKLDNNKIYLTGSFKGSFLIGNNASLINNSSYTDGYLIKIDGIETADWAKRIMAHSSNATGFSPSALEATDQEIFMSANLIGSFDVLNLNGQSHYITNNSAKPNACLVKYRSDGTIVWSNLFESIALNRIYSINLDGPNFYLFGLFDGTTDFNTNPNVNTWVSGNDSAEDYFIGKYTDCDCPSPFTKLLENEDAKFNNANLIIYPINNKIYEVDYNTTSDLGNMSLRVLNTLGQELMMGEMHAVGGGYSAQIDMNTASNGVYFVELYNNNHKVTKRFLVK